MNEPQPGERWTKNGKTFVVQRVAVDCDGERCVYGYYEGVIESDEWPLARIELSAFWTDVADATKETTCATT